MRRSARFLGLIAAVLGCCTSSACRGRVPSSPLAEPVTNELSSSPTPGLPWFEDVTATSGIDFRHYDSSSPTNYIQEMLGSGLGWIDYDNDGWLDLFCVQDGPVRPADAN